RAFVLSTSFAGMNELYERVAPQIDYPSFLQGSTSKSALLKKFRSTPNAVLFATASFWQGVDVRGEQLSCVIIDKLPFAVPSDHIFEAGTRSSDSQHYRSRRAGRARSAFADEDVWADLFAEFAAVSDHFRHRAVAVCL